MLYRTISAGNLLLTWLIVTAHGSPADLPASATPPSTSDSKRDDVRFAQLSPTVWMHTSMKEVPAFGLVPANGLLVIDGDHSILIDTAWNDDQTARFSTGQG
jgi:metallo-beta-lactamase class B